MEIVYYLILFLVSRVLTKLIYRFAIREETHFLALPFIGCLGLGHGYLLPKIGAARFFDFLFIGILVVLLLKNYFNERNSRAHLRQLYVDKQEIVSIEVLYGSILIHHAFSTVTLIIFIVMSYLYFSGDFQGVFDFF